MNFLFALLFAAVALVACSTNATETSSTSSTASAPNTMTATKSLHDFSLKTLEGEDLPLSQFKGKVVVCLNVASKCGYTPQYEDWEAFYKANKDKNVVVLGFPSNQFGGQEPGSAQEIREFCTRNYGVSFPMTEKIEVRGKDQHPVYQYLTKKELNGVLDAEVKWNFNKFLVDRDGHVVAHFGSGVKPSDREFTAALDKLK